MFRRGGDEDPFGGLGGTGSGASPFAAGTTAPVAPASQPERRKRRSDGPLLLVFSLVTILATAGVMWHEERVGLRDKKAQQAVANTKGLSPLSLLRSTNLRRGIGAAAARLPAGTVVLNMTVHPTELDLVFRQPDEHSRTVEVDPRFKVSLLGSLPNDNAGIAPASIDTLAPARMIAAVSRRTGLPASRVDRINFSFNPILHQASWQLELADVPPDKSSYTADAHGGDVRTPGEPDAATRAQQRAAAARAKRAARDARAAQLRGRRRARCFQRAQTARQLTRCASL